MSNERIKPLFEDPSASPELRNFVALARSDGASQADLDRLAKGLGPILGVSAGLIAAQASAFGSAPTGLTTGLAPSAGWAPAASAAKAGLLSKLLASSSAKLVAVGLSVGVASVGTWELQRAEPGAPGPRVSATAAVARPVAVPTLDHAGGAGANEELVEEALAEPEAAPVAAQAIAPIAPVQAHVVRRAVAARSALSSSGASAQALPSRTEAAPAALPAAAEAVAPAPAQPLVAQPAVTPPSELSLIRRAQAAHDDTGEALTLIAQHEQLYPHGALTQEREMLAIEVLLKAGRSSVAQSRAARFETSYPGSAHLPRLHALLQRAGINSK